jgi:hypothetical protein
MLVDSGRAIMVLNAAGPGVREDLVLRLYTNVIVWAHDTVLGGITQAAWGGYAPQTMLLLNWNMSFPDGNFNAVSLHSAAKVFQNTSGGPVVAKGFYVTGLASGILYGGAAFSSDLTIADGTSVSTFPQMLCNSIPASP